MLSMKSSQITAWIANSDNILRVLKTYFGVLEVSFQSDSLYSSNELLREVADPTIHSKKK